MDESVSEKEDGAGSATADAVLSFALVASVAHYITSFLRTELKVTRRKLLKHHDANYRQTNTKRAVNRPPKQSLVLTDTFMSGHCKFIQCYGHNRGLIH